MTKIRGVLAYEGVKPPDGLNIFTRRGVDWLRSLGLEPVDCYLRLMYPLNGEIRRLSLEPKHMAGVMRMSGYSRLGGEAVRRLGL